MSGSGRDEFICERLIPVPGSGDTAAMARGEPGPPGAFTWRAKRYRVAGGIGMRS